MAQELMTMTPRELSRHEVIKRLIDKEINGTEASKQTGLSVRQVKRIKARVKKDGARGIIHGLREKPSNRRMTEEKVRQIQGWVKDKYPDFGPTFAKEKLEEDHGIKVGKETLRLLMIKWELWKTKPRKKNKEYRAWRQRKEQSGEMVQFDGSYHHWFEDRAEKCCLLAAIDDATGKILRLQFVHDEGTMPVFSFWKTYLEQQGKPLSIYLDRLRTYKQNLKSVFDDPHCRTQFQRAIEQDLNIKIIHAFSPQAKGRAERLFNTLQDRLVKELRLAGISTIKEANQFVEQVFIPKHNARFAVVPQKKGDLHQPLTAWEKDHLDKIFSVQDIRIVNNDFTVRFAGQWYQLAEQQPCLVLRKDKVLIEKRLDGSLRLGLRNKELNYVALPSRPEKVKMKVIGLTRSKSSWKPPADHPWRKPFILAPSQRCQTPSLVGSAS